MAQAPQTPQPAPIGEPRKPPTLEIEVDGVGTQAAPSSSPRFADMPTIAQPVFGQPASQPPRPPFTGSTPAASQPSMEIPVPPSGRRLALIVTGAVVIALGIGTAAIALSNRSSGKPSANQGASTTSSTQSPSASQAPSTTPKPSSSPTPFPSGSPGVPAGQPGAEDVVIRGLYVAAADHDFVTVCQSQTPTAQGRAAKAVGWDGKGDPLPLCEKYFMDNWGVVDARHLRAVKVVGVTSGVDANHMTIIVDDPLPDGSKPTRPFAVLWNGSRWLIGDR